MDRALVAAAVVALVAVAAGLLRRRGSGAPERVSPEAVGLDADGPVGVVAFSSRFCLPCQAWEEALAEIGVPFTKVDVGERPDLVRRYGVRSTPLVLAVRLPRGDVAAAYRGPPRDAEVERLRELTAAPATA
jgi:glutaredoxin